MSMGTVKLTVRAVEAAVRKGKDYFLWDTDVRGFGLKVTAAGKKVYVLQYRMGGRTTPTRRHTIGTHNSPWQPGDARNEARRILEKVRIGIDPRVEAIEPLRAETDLRFDRYAQNFLELYGSREWASGTYRNKESNIRRWIAPVIGSRPLNGLRTPDVAAILGRIPAGSEALRRDVFKLIGQILNWAVERGDLAQSPIRGMKTPKAPPSRDRVLTDAELKTILAYTHSEPEWAVWGPFMRLLLITGQRRGEVAGMRWEELDRNAKTWTLTGARVKNRKTHVVPLNDLMVLELDDLAKGPTWPHSGAIFEHKPGARLSGFSKMKKRLDRILTDSGVALARPWRLHDIRRTFATGLQKLGVPSEVISALQNHLSAKSKGVAAIYQLHEWTDEKVDAMALWSDYLKALVHDHKRIKRWGRSKGRKYQEIA